MTTDTLRPLRASMRQPCSWGWRCVRIAVNTLGISNLTSVGVRALEVLLQRNPETVFPAHYHHCWYSAIERAFRQWESCTIHPRYFGADYFKFLGPAERTYLLYEDWTIRHNYKNLATYYLIVATR